MLSSFLPKASLLVGLSFVGFYSQQYLKVLGGTLPSRDLPSWRPEHKEAERRRFMNMVRWRNFAQFRTALLMAPHNMSKTVDLLLQEREAAPDDPVIMNPFRHVQQSTLHRHVLRALIPCK